MLFQFFWGGNIFHTGLIPAHGYSLMIHVTPSRQPSLTHPLWVQILSSDLHGTQMISPAIVALWSWLREWDLELGMSGLKFSFHTLWLFGFG